ncbi:MAG: hypothetical protein WC465_04555 [Patescibacteria group bacterium]
METGKKKMGFFKKMLIGAGVTLVVIIVIAASSDNDNENTNQSNQQAATTNQQQGQQPEQSIIKVTAVKLSEEYDTNSVAADAKYKNEMVEVSGVIDNIGKDIIDTPYVTLYGPSSSLFGIQCMFNKEDEVQLAALSKEQNIVLRGKVEGEIIGNVIVRGCSIVK